MPVIHNLYTLLLLNTVINPQFIGIKRMLLDKPIKKNDIITLKLLTGEEVIGQFQEDTDGQLIVSKASIVAANPQGGLGLVPWMMSSMPEKISINKDTVVTYGQTAEAIADKFLEATTNITLAK